MGSSGWEITRDDDPNGYLQQFGSPYALGFGVSSNTDLFGQEMLTLVAPVWFLTLILAMLPTIWFLRWRKRRNLPDITCPSCGYDLTGNETGKCPECGHEPETEIAQA